MNKYNQKLSNAFQTRFDVAPMSGVEFSKMTATPTHLTAMNAGDIVPIYCAEVLPNDTFDIDLDFVIRQNTVLTPTMAQMDVDFFAFFVPNRVVNQSWKNVQGENTSGRWVAPEVNLVPVWKESDTRSVQIPVRSVADYYGYPTQAPIPSEILSQMHDLKFRGYLDIYNNYFRSQDYQPPIPYSKLNIYNGFLEPANTLISASASSNSVLDVSDAVADGSNAGGAVVKALYGDGAKVDSIKGGNIALNNRRTSWSALDKPLKANKKHDYFTSVLPSPQKGRDVTFNIDGQLSKQFAPMSSINSFYGGIDVPTKWTSYMVDENNSPATGQLLGTNAGAQLASTAEGFEYPSSSKIYFTHVPDLRGIDVSSTSLSVDELRMGIAIQQTFELMARGGTRYREFVKSFFGIEADEPFKDVPTYLGHIRRGLDLYQTAQTSSSTDSDTPQGNLAAFGYTSNGGKLFHETFLEHGYVHILAVVRHQNVYASFLGRDNFRLNALDYYLPTLANISEQPVYTREINPFYEDTDGVFGYQEAWAEYRFEPNRVTAEMRTGVEGSLAIWNYADEFDSGLAVCDDDFLKSNSAEVLDRSLAVTSSLAPQFKAQFVFNVTKQRPMPVYSVPGLDIL